MPGFGLDPGSSALQVKQGPGAGRAGDVVGQADPCPGRLQEVGYPELVLKAQPRIQQQKIHQPFPQQGGQFGLGQGAVQVVRLDPQPQGGGGLAQPRIKFP